MADKATMRHLASLAALAVAGTISAAPVAVAAVTTVTVSEAVRATVAHNAVLVSASAGRFLDVVGVGWGQPQKDGGHVDYSCLSQASAHRTDADVHYAEILAAV